MCFFFFEKEFQPIMSAFDDSFLSSAQWMCWANYLNNGTRGSIKIPSITIYIFLKKKRRKHYFSPYILGSQSIWFLHFSSSQFGFCYF